MKNPSKTLPVSQLSPCQELHFSQQFRREDKNLIAYCHIRHDDQCGNGHNTFSITGEIWEATTSGIRTGRDALVAGCIHAEIARLFPFQHLLRWHLCGTDGPLHYVANTRYFVDKRDLQAARLTAIWPDATDDQLMSIGLESRLLDRLPALMEEFKRSVESIGLVY